MELIRKTKREITKSNYWIYYGIFLCIFCGKEVERRLCDGKVAKSCGCQRYKLSAESNKGKKRTKEQIRRISEGHKNMKLTEAWKNNISKALKGKIVLEKTKQKIGLANKGKKRTDTHKELYSKINKGSNNPNWNKGSSFLPYPPEFNKELKQQILKRDNYTCQCPNCEYKTDNLIIHHIDYDKTNNNPENLTTLCNSCHSKTNGIKNRQYWTEFYQNIMMNKLLGCLL